MCTVIVTIRSVVWSVMTIAATLMILVSLFSDRWLIGGLHIPTNLGDIGQGWDAITDKGSQLFEGHPIDKEVSLGIFIDCTKPNGNLFFHGECIPNLDKLESQFYSEKDDDYPHIWKGGLICISLGLLIMVTTVVWSLLSPCLRHCCCCSIFTLGGSLQFLAATLFSLALLAYPAGFGSRKVKFVCGNSQPFQLGDCQIGGSFWLAVVGTVFTWLSTYLATLAYKSTQVGKARFREEDGDQLICLP